MSDWSNLVSIFLVTLVLVLAIGWIGNRWQ